MTAILERDPVPACSPDGAAQEALPSEGGVLGVPGTLARIWDRFDAPPGQRRIPGTTTIAMIATVVGLAASWASTRHGTNLDYSDAQSHLTIARRIIESKSPGLQQLGTVWLPAPHLLLLPLVQSSWLWRTGWAACLLGTMCLAASAAALYRIAARIGLGRVGRLVAVLSLVANPSLLYVFTTALTEPVLIAGMLGAVAGLARWATARRTPSGGELAVFAGIPASIAVLSRYEGWALILAGALFVALVSVHKRSGAVRAARAAACFAAPPACAIAWWLAYNWSSYHDPLEFMFGPYSANAQQKDLFRSGLLPTKWDFGLSLSTYDWAVVECAGAVLLVTAFGGLAALVWRHGFVSVRSLVVALLAVSYSFSLLSLYLGQTAIDNDHSLPPNWWNNRFELSTMPLFALLAGVLLHEAAQRRIVGRLAIIAFIIALAGQFGWFMADLYGRSAILAEAAMSRHETSASRAAGHWLAAHYHGGGILLDESARGNAILPIIGIDLSQYDIRASGSTFDAALVDPAAHDQWILANIATAGAPHDSGPADLVAAALAADPQQAAKYRMVFRTADHAVYERISNSP